MATSMTFKMKKVFSCRYQDKDQPKRSLRKYLFFVFTIIVIIL